MSDVKKYLDLELTKYFGSKMLEQIKANFIRLGDGVTQIEAGTNEGEIKVTKKGKAQDGSLDLVSAVVVPGVVTTPSYDSSTRTFTFPVSDGESVVISLGAELVIDKTADNKYNDETGNLELYFGETDPETGDPVPVTIPIGDLVDIYNFTSSNGTVTAAITTDVETKEKTVDLKVRISDKRDNALQIIEDVEEDLENDIEGVQGGLYVSFDNANIDLTGYVRYNDVASVAEVDAVVDALEDEIFGLEIGVSKLPTPVDENVATNTDAISAITRDGDVFTVSIDVDGLTAFESEDVGSGSHKWIGLSVKTGVKDITKVKKDNVSFTADDVAEAEANKCKVGNFVLYVAADSISEDGITFTLAVTGYPTKTVTVKVEDIEE